jgi:hypothetical protein
MVIIQPKTLKFRLEGMRVRRTILNSDKIREINDAVLIVKHFVELSSKLLPFLVELYNQEDLSEKEEQDKQKILEVFNSYSFDPSTSMILLNSPILDLIKNTCELIQKNESSTLKLELEKLRIEHNRLKNNWKTAVLN